MDVSEDVVSTLRAEAHHPPVLLDEHPAAAGFCTEHSANARGVGYGEETSPTLRVGVVPAAIALDYHPADSRIGIGETEKIQTLTSRMGDGREQRAAGDGWKSPSGTAAADLEDPFRMRGRRQGRAGTGGEIRYSRLQ